MICLNLEPVTLADVWLVMGWVQFKARDELLVLVMVEFDQYYLLNQSFSLDLKIILQTALNVVLREGMNH